jgi:hypothetical protein
MAQTDRLKITVGHEQLDAIMDHLICPLSNKIFLNPVISNNVIYEASELEKKSSYDTSYTLVITLKSFIDDLIKEIPELQQFRYVETEERRSYAVNKNKILNLIENRKYDELLNYNSFSLADIGKNIENLLKGASEQVVTHLIDNALDPNAGFIIKTRYDTGSDITSWKLIHCVARWGKVTTLTYLINNGVDVNTVISGELYTPLQLASVDALQTNNYDKIHCLLGLGANLFLKDKHGITNLYYICNYTGYNCVKTVIEQLAENLVSTEGMDTIDANKLMEALQNNDKMEINQIMDCAECITSVFNK